MAKKKNDKEDINNMGLTAIADYFALDEKKLEALDAKVLKHYQEKAKLGMQFEREIGLQARSEERHMFRAISLVAEDKKDLRKLIKKALPKYYVSTS